MFLSRRVFKKHAVKLSSGNSGDCEHLPSEIFHFSISFLLLFVYGFRFRLKKKAKKFSFIISAFQFLFTKLSISHRYFSWYQFFYFWNDKPIQLTFTVFWFSIDNSFKVNEIKKICSAAVIQIVCQQDTRRVNNTYAGYDKFPYFSTLYEQYRKWFLMPKISFLHPIKCWSRTCAIDTRIVDILRQKKKKRFENIRKMNFSNESPSGVAFLFEIWIIITLSSHLLSRAVQSNNVIVNLCDKLNYAERTQTKITFSRHMFVMADKNSVWMKQFHINRLCI